MQLQTLGQQLRTQLPDTIPLALQVEAPALQASLEQYIDTVLRERFEKLEKELSSRVANLEGAVNSGIAGVSGFQKKETEQINEYLRKIQDHQSYQQGVVEEIRLILREREAKGRAEGDQFRTGIEELRKGVEKMKGQVQSAEQRTQKERIKVNIASVAVEQGYLIMQVENRKEYAIEGLFVQFLDASGLPIGEKEKCWTEGTYSLAAQTTVNFYSQLCPETPAAFHLCDPLSTVISVHTPLP